MANFGQFDPALQIPLTEFTLGSVVTHLNASKCPKWQQLIAHGKGPVNVCVESLSGKGFLSAVQRIIFGFENGEEDGRPSREFHIVLKVPTVAILQQARPLDSPQKIAHLAQMIGAFHRREIAFYGEIVPVYLQNIAGLSPLIPQAWAWQDCFRQNEEGNGIKLGRAFLLMDDLGGANNGRHVDGDVTEKQIDSVMMAIARLHAHSLAIPTELLQRHFKAEKAFKYDRVRLHNQLCSLPPPTGPYFSANSRALGKFLEVVESGQEVDAKIANDFGVNPAILCHGDLWLNNLLFAGDELKGILDWQTVHLGSGVSDISHLILTGVNPTLRRGRTEHWLGLYHSVLVEALSALPVQIRSTPLANLETVNAIYKAQFPAQVHFLMCLEAFLVNKPDDEDDQKVREKMRERLVQGFDEIRLNYE